jgi:type II restriction/modification system DNA methylase subunit YeeA
MLGMLQHALEHLVGQKIDVFGEHAKDQPVDEMGDPLGVFAAMMAKDAKHRMVGFERVHWFNGGLFDSDDVIALEKADVKNLLAAATLDWSEIDPSILGTLFERGLDPDKRSQLGAHYTDRDKIMMILDPVIKEPLEAEWADTKAAIEAELEKAKTAKSASAQTKAGNRAQKLHSDFMEKLAGFRVLDPACGSGNFLYLALLTLKDIEHRANLEAEALGLPRGFPRVGPESVLGIEINPYAAELARVSVWIGEIQWMRKNGFSANTNPVLRPLETIECADALVVEDLETGEWSEKAWPKVDVIVGNPPFLGDKKMIGVLGEDYAQELRKVYRNTVPGGADLVTYWIAKGAESIAVNRAQRIGFVSTNSIRGGVNREVTKWALKRSRLYFAWSDEPWVVDGAAVRVSMIGLEALGDESSLCLNGHEVSEIYSDLTGANSEGSYDLTKALRLKRNFGKAVIGRQKDGPLNVPGEIGRGLATARGNPHGVSNSKIVRPWRNGMDLTRRATDQWLIDFMDLSEHEAALFEAPFEYVREHVKPLRASNRDPKRRSHWWRPGRTGDEIRSALNELDRYIGTPRVSKYRVLVWLDASINPDCQIVAIARDDDTTFGILHSRFHELWSLRMGTSLEDRPRYTPTTTFETFPFPEGLTPDIPAADYADDPRAQAIAKAAARLNELRENWLNPPDLVRREPEVVEGYPDRILPVDEAAAKELKKRTLTNLYNARPAWLEHAHQTLDEAVAAAYGWPADLSDDEVLAKLFELNQARAKEDAE